jgi:hypothetical protein
MLKRNQGKISISETLASHPTRILQAYYVIRKIEMNRQLLRTVLGFTLVVVGLLAIVSCVPGEYNNAEAASLAIIPADARAKADAASLARWDGLGEHYASLARAEIDRGASADVARWEARGAYFRKLAEVQSARGQAAGVARWIALGEHYTQQRAQANEQMTADIARWIAKGERYQ